MVGAKLVYVQCQLLNLRVTEYIFHFFMFQGRSRHSESAQIER